MKNAAPQPPLFVIAAEMAGRLHGVLGIAREITLSAGNAKSIAARGGDKTAGFKPITDYVNEVARDTISLVTRINQAALQMSMVSVDQLRRQDARRRFARLFDNPHGDANAPLAELVAMLDRRIAGDAHTQRSLVAQLGELFDELEQRSRASRIIATNARVEAARAGEFQPYLESIADNVERASEAIRREMTVCRHSLATLTGALQP